MSCFITFEGMTGSGKTTQLYLLAEDLRARGTDVLITREPGGTAIGDRIRDILLDMRHTEMLPLTDVLLFSASRAQLVGQVICPHLARGGVVLCDRYADSTLAYQGYGRGVDLRLLRQITTLATGGLVPDLTIYLDLPVEQGLQRRKQAAGVQNTQDVHRSALSSEDALDRLDTQQVEFHCRVRQGYLELAAAEPERWVVVDATPSMDKVQQAIRRYVYARLGRDARDRG